MDQTTVEVLILATNALGAGILLFIAGVVQKIMNDMDPATFRWFLNRLDRTAMTNPFAVVIATLPVLMIVPYFVIYRLSHCWFASGFIVWFLGSIVTKVTNMPVYKWVGDPNNTDLQMLNKQKLKLQLGNNLRALITFGSVVLMAAQFGVRDVAILLAASLAIALPLLWWARKYIPN